MKKVVVKKRVLVAKKDHYFAILVLSLMGMLFSGYLTYFKLFGGVCPLKGECASLLGLPTCLYGFLLFFFIFLFSVLKMLTSGYFFKGVRVFSILGLFFSLYYSFYDLFFSSSSLLNGSTFTLGLPSCVYGFILFVSIWFLS